jgi:ATP-dependent DNA ligase
VFDLICHKRHGGGAVLIAFDLVELDGEHLRRSSIEFRKRKLAKLVARSAHLGIVLNEHYEGDGQPSRRPIPRQTRAAGSGVWHSGLS